MDFQSFVNCIGMPCCVMSVARDAAGGCGEIRILRANAAYRAVMGPAYYDGMPYEVLVPKDNKFEEYCYQAAILGKRMHAYVETRALNCWTDQTLIPLASDRADLGYCQFIFEFTTGPEAERMASVSLGAAEAVIKASVNLMGDGDFQARVGSVLDVIMEASAARSCRIMLVDHEHREAVLFSERLVPGAWPLRDPAEGDVIDYELIRSWEDVVGVSNEVIVKNAQDMAALEAQNPAWVASMRSVGVESLVLIPLRGGRNIIGYMFVANFDVERIVEVKELIELTAFFLGTEIYNHQLLDRLDAMSRTDALTGLQNRNAMTLRMKELQTRGQGRSFGVVNLDLNGLKTVNDRDGHGAGDRLLIQAGEILRKVFHQGDLFRTGGDEFIVLCGDISRETFLHKVERLRIDALKNSSVSFAVGAYWSDGSDDLATAFRRADALMYADKEAYYACHPKSARRS